MRRLFVDLPNGPLPQLGSQIVLAQEEQHYAARVLRLSDGDEVELLDGSGMAARAVLKAHSKKELYAELLAPFFCAPQLANRPQLTVAVCAPKGERADWLVEKLAEQAAFRLIWLTTARSVVALKASHKDRFSRLMRAAVRQARHGRVPQMQGPVAWADFVAENHAAGPKCWLLDAAGGPAQAAPTATHQTLIVGPEGGFSPEELRLAQQAAYTRVSLGPHVLRVETAAIVAAGVWGLLAGAQGH